MEAEYSFKERSITLKNLYSKKQLEMIVLPNLATLSVIRFTIKSIRVSSFLQLYIVNTNYLKFRFNIQQFSV